MTQAKAPQTARREPLRRIVWEQIKEPGAYVEIATGMLYRVLRESLDAGGSPLIETDGGQGARPLKPGARPSGDSEFVRVSANPHIFSLGARMLCVEHDIQPRF